MPLANKFKNEEKKPSMPSIFEKDFSKTFQWLVCLFVFNFCFLSILNFWCNGYAYVHCIHHSCKSITTVAKSWTVRNISTEENPFLRLNNLLCFEVGNSKMMTTTMTDSVWKMNSMKEKEKEYHGKRKSNDDQNYSKVF